ncbi:hypothetical protein ABW19_dt0205292 [Dactylella cylindrospora]|nr:hypothetical protein ABW19_dt0205292 [Dactylella cylindrospora]
MALAAGDETAKVLIPNRDNEKTDLQPYMFDAAPQVIPSNDGQNNRDLENEAAGTQQDETLEGQHGGMRKREKVKFWAKLWFKVVAGALGLALLGGLIVGIYAAIGCFKPENFYAAKCSKRRRFSSDAAYINVKGSAGWYFLVLGIQLLVYGIL